MTREEAKRVNVLPGMVNSDIVKKVINEIYDDFESRTCESCKYHTKDLLCSLGICHFEINTDPDIFGCNKWE